MLLDLRSIIRICETAQEMSPQHRIRYGLILIVFALSKIKAELGTFDYMVDCSACQFTPMTNIESYSCAVRCGVEGKCSTYLYQWP